jgi:hypothetical protein
VEAGHAAPRARQGRGIQSTVSPQVRDGACAFGVLKEHEDGEENTSLHELASDGPGGQTGGVQVSREGPLPFEGPPE